MTARRPSSSPSPRAGTSPSRRPRCGGRIESRRSPRSAGAVAGGRPRPEPPGTTSVSSARTSPRRACASMESPLELDDRLPVERGRDELVLAVAPRPAEAKTSQGPVRSRPWIPRRGRRRRGSGRPWRHSARGPMSRKSAIPRFRTSSTEGCGRPRVGDRVGRPVGVLRRFRPLNSSEGAVGGRCQPSPGGAGPTFLSRGPRGRPDVAALSQRSFPRGGLMRISRIAPPRPRPHRESTLKPQRDTRAV